MASSTAKVPSANARHVASDVASAETSDVTSSEAADVASSEAADVASAEAAHVASAEAAHVASATTTSVSTATPTAGLCVGGKKAAGKHGTCQNHHHSSYHEFSFWDWRDFRHRTSSNAGVCQEGKCQCRDGLKVRMLICRFY
jgi:hypothetical protein